MTDPIALSIIATGALVGASAALLGSFLVLRGAAMVTDAISHSVLFGIVIVWLMTGATSGAVQLLGAAAAGLLTVVLSEALTRSRLVAQDAAIGLVFPALFAAGVLIINIHARDVHLDTDAVLLGQIGLVWLDTVGIGAWQVPRAPLTLAVVLAVDLGFVLAFWKELKLATFDPGLAAALGFVPGLLFHLLLGLTSATAVASFEAVGAVLFVAFAIIPPATAYLLTERLARMVALAVALALVASVLGYVLALAWDVSIGGMMATVSGAGFVLALVGAPQRGLVAGVLARRRERRLAACRTLVAHLWSHRDGPEAVEENTARALQEHLHWSAAEAGRTILAALDAGLIRREHDGLLALTGRGEAEARAVLRVPPAADA